jgi:Tol biopolymer transport system component
MRTTARFAALVAAAFLLASTAGAEFGGFGRNKVRNTKFDWQVMRTEHFDIHYYPGEEEMALEASGIAEDQWRHLGNVFRLMRLPVKKVPIFLYATAGDFRQTNITQETLDEGIGGFTEVFKTRVVLPVLSSPAERRHVLRHELVHAMQFFVLYGEGLRSYTLYKSVIIPLWFVEGMAEYFSDSYSPEGDMVLRDAVLYDRIPPLELLHSFNHLEPHDAYLGYKVGASAIAFLVDKYGEDKPGAMLKAIEDSRSFSQIFQEKAGVSMKDFEKKWRSYMKETYWSQVKGRKDPDDYGTPVFVSPEDRTCISTAASQSPVDDTVIFLSDKQGYRNLWRMKKGETPKPLLPNAKYERVEASPPDWSPDGRQIVVTVTKSSRTRFAILQSGNGRQVKLLDFPFLDISHPRFSTDGKSLVFAGYNGITTQIFIAEIATGKWRKLTSDSTAARAPVFSPDGKSLYFAAENDGKTGLFVIDNVSSTSWSIRSLGLEGNHPDVSQDGKWLLFDAPEGGILNLWAVPVGGKTPRRITDVRTGMYMGRWARDGRRLLATTMQYGSNNVYMLNDVMPMVFPEPAGSTTPAGEPAAAPAPAARSASRGPAPLIPASRLSPPERGFTPGFTVINRKWGPGNLVTGVIRAPFAAGPAFAAGLPKAAAEKQAVDTPAVPLALTSRLDGSRIILSWTPPAGKVPVSLYEIFRSTTGKNFRGIERHARTAVTGWKDSEWNYGGNYYYRVNGVDDAGKTLATAEVEVSPRVDVQREKYRFSWDSSIVDLLILVGSVQIGGGTSFAGYGVIQMSDLLGNNHVGLTANAVPGWQNSYGVAYDFLGWRPDIGLTLTAMDWSRFVYVQSSISTESFRYPPVLTGLQSGAVMVSYPFDAYHRAELVGGIQRFTEVFTSPDGEETSRKTSEYFPVGFALVRDTSRWNRLMPVGGASMRVEVTQAVPAANGLDFTEYSGETRGYWGILDGFSLATRLWGSLSTGPDRRWYYLGGRYSIRALSTSSQSGNAAVLSNNEARFDIARHMNISMPLLPILLTDLQGVTFIDIGSGFDPREPVSMNTFHPASIGAGINFIGFVFQSSPIMFSLEMARRIDRDQPHPLIYGRLGPVF